MGDFDAIFKAYDIRGIVGEQIDAAACFAIGGAFAVHTRGDGAARVVVGRDMRPDGAELAGAFCEGVVAAGVDVVDIGLCATEMVYFASGMMDAPAPCSPRRTTRRDTTASSSAGPARRPSGPAPGWRRSRPGPSRGSIRAAAPGNSVRRDLLDSYVEHVLSFVSVPALRPLRLAVDTANGMGGLVAPAVFEALPFEVDYLHLELDGTFPNHPADPLKPENLRDLQVGVRAGCADAGLAFDGDADRVFVVDEASRPMSGSLTAAIIASAMLEREPGSAVVHNLICSRALPEIVSERGGRPVRARVGHSFMKKAMADSSAVFGGEHSGHYYFGQNYGADSAMIAVLVALEALSLHGGRLSELAAGFERYAASGRSTPRCRIPRRCWSGWRPRSRAASRIASTVSASIAATGGSICGPRTPSRCCASTWRPPGPAMWRPGSLRCAP